MSAAPISISASQKSAASFPDVQLASPFHISPVSFRMFSPNQHSMISAFNDADSFASCDDIRLEDQKHCTGYTCCGMYLSDMHALLDHFETGHKTPARNLFHQHQRMMMMQQQQQQLQQPRPIAISTSFDSAQDIEPDFDMDLDDGSTDATSPRTPLHSHRSSPALVNPGLGIKSVEAFAAPNGTAYFPPQVYTYAGPYSPTTPISPYSNQGYEINDHHSYPVPELRTQGYNPQVPPHVQQPFPSSRLPSFAEPHQPITSSQSTVIPPQVHPSHVLLVQNPYLHTLPAPPKPIVPPSLYALPQTSPTPFPPQGAPAVESIGRSDSVSTLDSNASSPFTEEDEDAEGEDEDVMDADADGSYGVQIDFASQEVLPSLHASPSPKRKSNKGRRGPSAGRASIRKKALGGGRKPADPNREKLRCPHPGCEKLYSNQNGLKYHLEKGTCTNAGDKH